ncbi:hypothetical protein IGI04_015244 [Brassica rapa subsp. trilocularis]|uniref:Secreted protein n=1 Tax=Brassica rapa subsp. trilocularis TaxID=1813537 RepID=A0ABQ7MPH7_BRACM|nr:hypothetical protein IGI04_015244 [Brassica rapa subsp. trilocularis]
MLLQWPLARLPHLRFFSTRSLFRGLGCCSTNFSLSVLGNYGRLVVLVSLATSLNARSSITSQHHIGQARGRDYGVCGHVLLGKTSCAGRLRAN